MIKHARSRAGDPASAHPSVSSETARRSLSLTCTPSITICLFYLLLTVNLGAAASSPELASLNDRLRTGKPVTIAAIGDSITYICWHTDSRQNYVTFVVDAVRKLYPRAQINTVVAGNSHGLENRRIRLQQEVLAAHADLVFIMFGMNDCSAGSKGLGVYDASLTEMIHRSRENGTLPIIVTQNAILYNTLAGDARKELAEYMARAVQVALRERCLYVDNYSDWQTLQREEPTRWTEYLDDAIHPGIAGHRRFAKHILESLWPDAAQFQYSGLRPPLPESRIKPTVCLLGGPADKQILRVSPTSWLVLTGGKRGTNVTDLILWVCENNAKPTGKDFRPITLIGPGPEALFDWTERSINSAVLVQARGKLLIVFTPTVRINCLSVGAPKDRWYQTLAQKTSYTPFNIPEAPIPQAVRGCSTNNCAVLDEYLDPTGEPAFLVKEISAEGKEELVQQEILTKNNPNFTKGISKGDEAASRSTIDDFRLRQIAKAAKVPPQAPLRYEAHPPLDAQSLGVLSVGSGLEFTTVVVPQ